MHFILILSLLMSFSLNATSEQETLLPDYRKHKTQALVATVDYFESLFWTQYAPIAWKVKYWKWNPRTEGLLVKQALINSKDFSFGSNKKAFNRYLGSCRDLHVGVTYNDTRTASIPIMIDWIDNRVLVTTSNIRGITQGDEILKINDLATLEYFSQEIYGTSQHLAPLNRLSFRIHRLFFRRGMFDALPHPTPLNVTVKKPNGTLSKVSVTWSFKDNVFADEPISKQGHSSEFESSSSSDATAVLNSFTILPNHRFKVTEYQNESIDENIEMKSGYQQIAFGKIYQIGETKIGYLSIPDFSHPQLVSIAARSIQQMSVNTDALLIDIRDNPGGELYKCWGVLSMLAQKPLANPVNSEILDEALIDEYRHIAELFNKALNEIKTDQQLQIIFKNNDYPFTLDRIREIRNFCLNCIEEWSLGNTCTRFMPLSGESFIHPHASVHYKKPIFVLINERAASCGDIFPAILQDNQRATLIGNTTTGAGGTVRSYKLPNFAGIKSFSLTRSLLLRNNQQVIEDLGVSPDYAYKRSLDNAIFPQLELEEALDFVAKKLQESTPSK